MRSISYAKRNQGGAVVIERRTLMGKNASMNGRTFCQECELERWRGYYLHFEGLAFGVFVCDECLSKAKKGVVCSGS